MGDMLLLPFQGNRDQERQRRRAKGVFGLEKQHLSLVKLPIVSLTAPLPGEMLIL